MDWWHDGVSSRITQKIEPPATIGCVVAASGAPMPGLVIPAGQARKFDLAPKQVTAALIGLKGRVAVFAVQRFVANYADEPLMAVLPGVALDELWTAIVEPSAKARL